MQRPRQGSALTLVELIIVMVVSGILFVTTPPLVFHGVKTLVFLPRALAVNQTASEALHQIVEGGFSILAGQTTIRGLRFAVRRSTAEPALWLAEDNRIGFRNSDGQDVLIRWDSSTPNQEVIRRDLISPVCLPPNNPGEILPYYAQGIGGQGTVRILQIPSATPIFRYYNQSGALVAPTCPPSSTIRRVDIAFIAQTGSGVFDEGQAKEQVASSVAIRVP